MSFTIGQTVRYTNASSEWENITLGNTYEVLNTDGRDICVKRDNSRFQPNGWYPAADFTPVSAQDFKVGDRVVVSADAKCFQNSEDVPTGGVFFGQEVIGTVAREANAEGNLAVEADLWNGTKRQVVAPQFLTPVGKAETLDEYRVSFMEKALARASSNGPEFVVQVTAALDFLARMEYITPSKTVEDFQKRVVTLGMEKKVEHRWCTEPEEFFKSIGLGHLIPVTKRVTVTITLDVHGEVGMTDRQARQRARDAVSYSGDVTYVSRTTEVNP